MKRCRMAILYFLFFMMAAVPAQAEVVPAVTAEAAVVMDLDTGEVL